MVTGVVDGWHAACKDLALNLELLRTELRIPFLFQEGRSSSPGYAGLRKSRL
jgi:hypothetical protein